MNNDLIFGLALLAAVSASASAVGLVVAQRAPEWATSLVLLATVVLVVWFAFAIHGRLIVAWYLPYSNAIVLGNGILPGLTFIAGVVIGSSAVPWWRRTLLAGVLAGVSLQTLPFDVAVPTPRAEPSRFLDGVVAQTTAVSCSPCCAATLLREYEISATEQDMMRLCLTRKCGTPELGLYRGLALKTHGTRWNVDVLFGGAPSAELLQHGPVILPVDSNLGSAHSTFSAFDRGVGDHTVVLFRFTASGSAEIGDPTTGRVYWGADELAQRWTGVVLRIVPRVLPQIQPKRSASDLFP